MKQIRISTILLVVLLVCKSISAEEQASDNTQADTRYKYTFSLFELRSLLGMVCLALMMVLCTLGGIGGNLVILPVCMVFFQFDPHVAIGHTAFFAGISSLVRVFVEVFNESSKKKLNFDAALLSSTPCIIGSVIGVFFNKMFPNIIILGMCTILLFVLMIKSFNDFKKMSAKEDKEQNKITVKSPLVEMEHIGQEDKEFDEFDPTPHSALHDQYKVSQNDFLFYLLIFIAPPLFSLLRGTKDRPSIIGIDRCGGGDLMLVLVYLVGLTFLTIHLKNIIQSRNSFVKQNVANVDFKRDEATNKMLVTMVGVGFIGTFMSAGFAILLNMSMIMLELTPFVASATSLYIGAILNLAASMVFYFEGMLYINCAIVGGLVIAGATLGVRLTIYERFVKSGKGSYTLFFMSIMLAMAIVSTLSVVGPKIKASHDAGENIWAFSSIC